MTDACFAYVEQKERDNMEYQLQRALSEKKKKIIIILMIIVPSLEILQVFYEYWKYGLELPYPMYATFLSLYSRGHIIQSLYLWFLPMYLLILVGEESIEDFKTGIKNILICRIGKTKYIKGKLKSSFITSISIVGIGLLVNFILVQFAYTEGTYLRYGGEYMVYDITTMPEILLFEWSYTNPVLTNLLYIVITMLFAGLIGMLGTMLSIVLHDRKLVYAITFALWFVPILFKNSFMLVFQPFSEYGFDTVVPLAVWTSGLYILITVVLVIWEEKCNEI